MACKSSPGHPKVNWKRKCFDPFVHKPKNPRTEKRGCKKKQRAMNKVKAFTG